MAKLLLKINVNIQTSSNRSGYDKFTPLHFAAENNSIEMVKILLAMPNINVNLRTSLKGFTALHFACVKNNTEMVKLLLLIPNINLKIKSATSNHGATMADYSYRRMTSFQIAIENKNFEIINLFAGSKKNIC